MKGWRGAPAAGRGRRGGRARAAAVSFPGSANVPWFRMQHHADALGSKRERTEPSIAGTALGSGDDHLVDDGPVRPVPGRRVAAGARIGVTGAAGEILDRGHRGCVRDALLVPLLEQGVATIRAAPRRPRGGGGGAGGGGGTGLAARGELSVGASRQVLATPTSFGRTMRCCRRTSRANRAIARRPGSGTAAMWRPAGALRGRRGDRRTYDGSRDKAGRAQARPPPTVIRARSRALDRCRPDRRPKTPARVRTLTVVVPGYDHDAPAWAVDQ